MAELNETAVNILNEMFPEMKENPLAISKQKITEYFKQLEYHKNNIFSIEQRNVNEAGYNRAFKLANKVLSLINVEKVKLPLNIMPVSEQAIMGLVTLPTFSPKQEIKKVLDKGIALTKYETAHTYSAIYLALYNECENEILTAQAQQIKNNVLIKLNKNHQRVRVYFTINPKNSIYDCAEYLALMPIQVIELKKAILYEFEEEEIKPFVIANIIR